MRHYGGPHPGSQQNQMNQIQNLGNSNLNHPGPGSGGPGLGVGPGGPRTHGQNRFERGRDAKMLPSELMHVTVDELLEIAKDKWKSRSLQRSLMENDVQMTELIYEKAEPAFVQLLSDQYGNYLSQKILEHCTDVQFDFLFSKVETKLSTLANEVHGTRAVQKFVEEGIARGRTQRILSALIDHVEPLSRSVTGFHVVVKLLEKIAKMTAEADSVLAKLCYDAASIVSMAKDQWGCCVLKTCVDKAEGERLTFIVEAIVNSTLELVQDPYGNYVVQHVLATTTSYDYVLPQMIERLKDHVLELCQQKFSSNVLEKVLTTAPESHKNMLIEGVLNAGKMDIHSVVQHLLFHQYGNYVLQQTLAVARDPYLTTLIDAIRPYVHQILRHMLKGEGPSSAPIPRRGGTTLAPEQAQRLAVKLGKRFPVLLDGLDEHEKAMLVSPNTWGPGFRSPTTMGSLGGTNGTAFLSGGPGTTNCGSLSTVSSGILNAAAAVGMPATLSSPNGVNVGGHGAYNPTTAQGPGSAYDYSTLLSANINPNLNPYGPVSGAHAAAANAYTTNPLLAALTAGNYNYNDLATAAAIQSAAGAALGLTAPAAAASNQAGHNPYTSVGSVGTPGVMGNNSNSIAGGMQGQPAPGMGGNMGGMGQQQNTNTMGFTNQLQGSNLQGGPGGNLNQNHNGHLNNGQQGQGSNSLLGSYGTNQHVNHNHNHNLQNQQQGLSTTSNFNHNGQQQQQGQYSQHSSGGSNGVGAHAAGGGGNTGNMGSNNTNSNLVNNNNSNNSLSNNNVMGQGQGVGHQGHSNSNMGQGSHLSGIQSQSNMNSGVQNQNQQNGNLMHQQQTQTGTHTSNSQMQQHNQNNNSNQYNQNHQQAQQQHSGVNNHNHQQNLHNTNNMAQLQNMNQQAQNQNNYMGMYGTTTQAQNLNQQKTGTYGYDESHTKVALENSNVTEMQRLQAVASAGGFWPSYEESSTDQRGY